MKSTSPTHESLCARTRRNNIRIFGWTSAWLVSQALAVFGPKFLWGDGSLLTLVAVGLNLVFGLGLIWALIRWLKDLDELQKRIQFESLALTVGVGVVGGINFSLYDITNLVSFDAEISYLVVLMSLVYMAAIGINTLRYR